MTDDADKVSIELKEGTILQLQHGDIVVFKVTGTLTDEQGTKWIKLIRGLGIPEGTPVLLIDDTASVSVLRPAADPFQTL